VVSGEAAPCHRKYRNNGDRRQRRVPVSNQESEEPVRWYSRRVVGLKWRGENLRAEGGEKGSGGVGGVAGVCGSRVR